MYHALCLAFSSVFICRIPIETLLLQCSLENPLVSHAVLLSNLRCNSTSLISPSVDGRRSML